MNSYTLLAASLLLSIAAFSQQPQLIVPVGHTSYLNYFALSPDGRHILTASSDQTTRLWDRDGHLIATLKESESNEVLAVDFSSDGQHLLTCGMGGVKIWNLSGEQILELSGSSNSNHAVFSPDGKKIAAGSTNGVVTIWDIAGKRLWRERAFSATVMELAFSPDGNHLAAVQQDFEKGIAKIWDNQNRKTADIQADESFTSLVFSPDSKTLLTGSINGRIAVWTPDGKPVKDFLLHYYEIKSLAAHPQRGFLSGSNDGTAVLFNLEEEKLQEFQHNAAVRLARFSNNGNEILSFSDESEAILFWDMQGNVRHRLNGYGADILSIAPHPAGTQLLVGSSNGARIWDLTGRDILHGIPHHTRVDEVAYSPDGQRMYTAGWDGKLNVFFSKDSLFRSSNTKGLEAVSLAVSRDGRYVLSTNGDSRAILWDSLGNEIQEMAGKDYRTYAADFFPSGDTILSASELLDARLWNTQTGELIKELPHNTGVEAALISPDGQYMLTRSKDDKLRLWDNRGELLWEDNGWELFEGRASFSPDSKVMAIPNGKNIILMRPDKTAIDTLTGHRGVVNTAVFSPDGRLIYSGSKDGMLKIWDWQRGEEIASLIQLGSNDWAVTAPSGLFDASPGAMRLMHYTVGNEIVSLSQLDERYYAPGLLANLMGLTDTPLRDVSKFDSVKLYPEVALRIVRDELLVNLTERNGGIGKISFLVNNKEVFFTENKDKQAEFRFDLKAYAKYYQPGPDNSLAVQVYNEAGWLKSAPVRINYSPDLIGKKGGKEEEVPTFSFETAKDPELFAVCIGTSDYEGKSLDLLYPDKDALAMSQALQASGRALFGVQAVHTYLLSTSQDSRKWRSNKENVKATLDEIAEKALSTDIILVYFSGHGIAYSPPGEESQFYYLTGAIGSTDLSDPEIRKNGAISTAELTDWIKEIAALKQILIFDACNSGKVLEDLGSAQKDLNADQILALERMKDRTGMFVLSGSAADKSSYEASRYGQGLLTFSLLQGMEYVARTSNGYVDVSRLFQYSLDKVPELAEGIGGMQTPRMAPPEGGQSFYIGIVNDTVSIPIAQEKPVFVRPEIRDTESFWDDPLGLEDEMAGFFRNESAKGIGSNLAYFDLPRYRNSYKIIARYDERGGGIMLRGAVTRLGSDKPELIGKVSWQGPKSKIKELVPALISQAYELLQQAGK
ncbi:MAG: caspase family protein [Phaeodactylibacter sp.]|nr:caspase family protein [Phaeodactylibacter sp.]MCB9049649.1 caspase family protein [Lewinellaceae bacterium]